MHFVQLGASIQDEGTTYRSVRSDSTLPYQSVWWLDQTAAEAGRFRFVPDLSIHLVFDLTGLLDVEPLLIHTGPSAVELALPAGVQLVGMQFVVWEARLLHAGANPETPTYTVRFDTDWAYLLYFTLLDARNAGATSTDTLQFLGQFRRWIDASLQKDLSAHFFQVSAEPEAGELAYSARHQRRLYHQLTGLSPGQFKRIVRFQNALQRIRAERRLSWDAYYDQAHFIREFKELTGITPGTFLRHYP